MCKNTVFLLKHRIIGTRDFFSPRDLGPIQPLLSGYRLSFPGVKRPERVVNHMPPSSAEVKKEWSYTSTLPKCLRGIDKENFAFLWKCLFNQIGMILLLLGLRFFTFELIQTALLMCAPNG